MRIVAIMRLIRQPVQNNWYRGYDAITGQPMPNYGNRASHVINHQPR